VFHIGQYNETNAFWARSLSVYPNERSERVRQNNERVRSNVDQI